MTTQAVRNRNIILATIAFAIISLLLGMWVRHNQGSTHESTFDIENGTIFSIPRDITPFNLVSAQQKPFTNSNLTGHWSVLFFGFTQCPQLCPSTLAILNDTYEQQEKKKNIQLPQIVFISVDPERDTPPVIQKYIASFNKNFLGATGSQDEIKKLTATFNVLYMKVHKPNDADPMSYQIDHSGTLLLVNPEGKLLALFSSPHTAEDLANNIAAIEARFSKET